MRQITSAIAAVGLALGLVGVTNADPITCTGTNQFESLVDVPNSGLSSIAPTGPYGEICVTLVDNNTADIEAATFAGFTMIDTNALALNFNGAVTLNGSITSDAGGPFARDTTGGSNVDGLGTFNFRVKEPNASVGATDLQFTVDLNSGTWATAADVLALNANQFDAAMHIKLTDCTTGTCTGFAGEGTGTPINEAPEPAVLGLLGIGLLGLGYSKRRRKA